MHAKTILPQYQIKNIKEKGTQGRKTVTTNHNTVLFELQFILLFLLQFII